MRVAIVCDTHMGVKSDAPMMLDYQEKFFKDIFFPTLQARNISTVFHLGDLVDRRKYINYNTAARTRKMFLEPVSRYSTHILIGNHDTTYKNTNEINALHELVDGKYNTIKIYAGPQEIELGDLTKIMLVPWRQ